MVLREWHGRACYKRESNQQGAPWAWPEQIVWLAVPIQETKLTGHGVSAAQEDCQHRFDQEQRRCLRCGLGEKEYEEREAAKLKGTWGVDLAAGPSWSDVTIGGLRSPGIAPIQSPITCRGCSSPAAPSSLDCHYCAHREYGLSEDEIRCDTEQQPSQVAARARMAKADRLERPRATADSRAFAKGHPWECGGEDEP